MINNNKEFQKMWQETLRELEEDMSKDIMITIEDDKLRGKLIKIFSIFDNISYDIDWDLTERRYGRKIYNENENIFFSYKNKFFEGIMYLFDYMKGCLVEPECVKELVESMKCFYCKLIEEAGEKEITIPNEKATDIYILIEKMFDENVKRGFKNNILDYLFVSKGQEEDKLIFVSSINALSELYNKIADVRGIPRDLRKKISLNNIA